MLDETWPARPCRRRPFTALQAVGEAVEASPFSPEPSAMSFASSFRNVMSDP